MTSYRVRLLNIALRLGTLGSRFLFIFFLAKFLDPKQLGLYGLFTATMTYSLYLLGLDFYTFTTREVLKIERSEWGAVLKNQGALLLLLYAAFIPLLSMIFIEEFLPWNLAGWFFALLVCEHLNQEIGRLLIAVSEQLLASILLFLRQGTWAIAIVALMALDASTRSLYYVFCAWVIAGFIAVLVGSSRLITLGIGGWKNKIDWKWIYTGLKISIPFLIATLAIRGVFTLDRYWLQSLGGLEIVGAYVLFIGISGTLMAFLDAGIFAFIYPGLISAYNKNQPAIFRKNLRTSLIQTIILSAGFSIVSLLLLSPLLKWIDNPLYTQHQYLYPWLLLMMVINALSMVPHYALYAQGIDRHIIYSHIASLLIFVAATWFFARHSPLLAVPFGLIAAHVVMLVWKAWAFLKFSPSHHYSTHS